MKTKRTTGSGLYEKSRQIARRWRGIIDRVENFEPAELPDNPPPMRLSAESLPRQWRPLVGTLKRALAA